MAKKELCNNVNYIMLLALVAMLFYVLILLYNPIREYFGFDGGNFIQLMANRTEIDEGTVIREKAIDKMQNVYKAL